MNMTKSQAKKVSEVIADIEITTNTYTVQQNGDDVVVTETYNVEVFKGRVDTYTVNRRGALKIQVWAR